MRLISFFVFDLGKLRLACALCLSSAVPRPPAPSDQNNPLKRPLYLQRMRKEKTRGTHCGTSSRRLNLSSARAAVPTACTSATNRPTSKDPHFRLAGKRARSTVGKSLSKVIVARSALRRAASASSPHRPGCSPSKSCRSSSVSRTVPAPGPSSMSPLNACSSTALCSSRASRVAPAVLIWWQRRWTRWWTREAAAVTTCAAAWLGLRRRQRRRW